MAENIVQTNLLQQHNQDYTMFAIEIIRHRMLPSPLDGLKPVHRRILYALFHDIKAKTPNARTVKTARVIGEVIGKYHPHGDSSVNDAIKPMVNPFEIYMPLIRGQGSFGSLYGDPAAAQRYTEITLSEYGLECIIGEMREADNATDWEDNFDRSLQEPEFLPARVPNLLINGSSGIAIGVATSIPKHNICEVIDQTIKMIDNPKHQVYLVPDNCTGSDIIATDFKEICRTGMGRVRMRGRLEVTEYQYRKNSMFPALKVLSMPDLVFFKTVKDQIEGLMEEKKLPMVLDILNNTHIDTKDGSEVFEAYIILTKECDPYYVREVIYKSTDMESTVSVNMEVVVNGHPKLMSYTEYIKNFIDFRMETKFRLYNNKYQGAITNHYKMQLFISAMESGKIKQIQEKIHKNKTRSNQPIIEWLVKTMNVTPIQAEWLIGLDQGKTSKGWLEYYKEQREKYAKEADEYLKMATSPEALMQEIRSELLAIKAKYGCPRRSRIISPEEASAIPGGMFRVIITKQNHIKKVGENEKTGSLGGDESRFQIPIDNRDELLIFTALGRVFSYPIHKVPFAPKGNPGADIRAMVPGLTSDICCVVPKSRLEAMLTDECKFCCFVITNAGLFKRMDIDDLVTVPGRGTVFSILNDGDLVKSVLFMPEDFELLIYSRNKVLRVPGSMAPYLRRATKGYNSMNSKYPIDGFECLFPGATDLVVVTEHGYVNKVSLAAVPLKKKGDTGTSLIKLKKTDAIKDILVCTPTSVLRFYDSSEKSIDMAVSDIQNGSSISSGVRLINNGISAVVKVDL